MARRCEITGVGALSGNLVSHSNHKTKTSFRPNLQNVSLQSDTLGSRISLRVTAATLRSIEHNGGLDQYLLNHSSRKLTEQAGKLKRQIERKLAKQAAAKAA